MHGKKRKGEFGSMYRNRNSYWMSQKFHALFAPDDGGGTGGAGSSGEAAISLLKGSKLDNTIASGVSSIIKSTPVTDSIVLIFLPSLPINLPFISSFGSSMVETV